jgi:PHD/YefM family antitoxin component YafN of YafNO toxin-antitoxin module
VQSDLVRSHWRETLNDIEQDGSHVIVSRYGKPSVVMVPVEWYEEAKRLLGEAQ